MIINETVLLEKFAESDEKAYDYLIDNVENDEQAEIILGLQKIFDLVEKEVSFAEYVIYRNIILEEELKIPLNVIEEI